MFSSKKYNDNTTKQLADLIKREDGEHYGNIALSALQYVRDDNANPNHPDVKDNEGRPLVFFLAKHNARIDPTQPEKGGVYDASIAALVQEHGASIDDSFSLFLSNENKSKICNPWRDISCHAAVQLGTLLGKPSQTLLAHLIFTNDNNQHDLLIARLVHGENGIGKVALPQGSKLLKERFDGPFYRGQLHITNLSVMELALYSAGIEGFCHNSRVFVNYNLAKINIKQINLLLSLGMAPAIDLRFNDGLTLLHIAVMKLNALHQKQLYLSDEENLKEIAETKQLIVRLVKEHNHKLEKPAGNCSSSFNLPNTYVRISAHLISAWTLSNECMETRLYLEETFTNSSARKSQTQSQDIAPSYTNPESLHELVKVPSMSATELSKHINSCKFSVNKVIHNLTPLDLIMAEGTVRVEIALELIKHGAQFHSHHQALLAHIRFQSVLKDRADGADLALLMMKKLVEYNTKSPASDLQTSIDVLNHIMSEMNINADTHAKVSNSTTAEKVSKSIAEDFQTNDPLPPEPSMFASITSLFSSLGNINKGSLDLGLQPALNRNRNATPKNVPVMSVRAASASSTTTTTTTTITSTVPVASSSTPVPDMLRSGVSSNLIFFPDVPTEEPSETDSMSRSTNTANLAQ